MSGLMVRRGARLAIDLLVLTSALAGAYLVRFDLSIPPGAMDQLLLMLPSVLLGKLLLMRGFGASRHSWQYISLSDIMAVVRAMVVAAVLLTLVRLVVPEFDALPSELALPLSVIVADLALSVLGLVGVRAIRRMTAERAELAARGVANDARTVVLIGAGRAGVLVARELHARPDLGLHAVGFLDDDPMKQARVIHGLPVLGSIDDLEHVRDHHGVDEAVIAIAAASGEVIRRIATRCEEAELPAKIIPGVYEMLDGRVNLSRLRPVAIEDLLGREPVELDVTSIRELVSHDVVLVTGAGGSIGSELCRQLARFCPRKLVLLERAENALWAIHRELEASFPTLQLVAALADVCDAERVDQLLLEHRPSTVFHAAAHKHVPMVESNPGEAVKNNVLGTKIVADLVAARGVARFVMISTDKAVNPTSVMGATKRVAERYVQHLAQRTGRPFVSVRFGNVLGSSGSVVPVFKEQIAAGGPVTVTHPDMQRYFMTIAEAAQLVLQAAAIGQSGEIFVLDMGEPVPIMQLAVDLIRLSGFTPHHEIAIEFTGVRPGEKLFEELSLGEEHVDRTRHPKIFVGRNGDSSWPDVDADVEQLVTLGDREPELRQALIRLVPEFVSTP